MNRTAEPDVPPLRQAPSRLWLGMEREEIGPTCQRALYLFFLLVSFVAAKSLRDAAFLETFGALNLPYMYLLLALAVGVIALLYNRVLDRFSCKALCTSSLGAVLLMQALFLVLYRVGWHWTSLLYYPFVASHGILISQFWLFLSRTYDIRRAKRLMVPIAAGGILGAVTGGLLVRHLAGAGYPVHFLLYLSGGAIAACFLLYQFMWRGLCPHRTITPDPLRIGQARAILTNPYLRKILAVTSLVAVTAVFVEYQLNVLVQRTYETAGGMATFFGSFYLVLGSAALAAQMLFARPLLRRSGVVTILILLPLGITAGSLLLLALPLLGVATAIRIWDGGIRHSLFRTATELLYLPLSELERLKTKVLLDTFVPKAAEGVAGLLLLLSTRLLALPFAFLPSAAAVLSATAVWVGLSLRRDYVERLRQRIETEPKHLARARIDFSDRTTLATITFYLNSLDPTDIVNTIRILANADYLKLVPPELLLHPALEVKKETLRVLLYSGRSPGREVLRRLFDHPDTELASDAVRLFARAYPREYREVLEVLVRSDRPEIRAVAAEIPACVEDEACRALARETILSMAEAPGREGARLRKAAARAIGNTASPEYRRLLIRLLEDEEPDVVRAAVRAAGRTLDLHTVAHLVDLLGDPRFSSECVDALARYGERITCTLFDFFRDPGTAFRVRARIPDVLGEIPGPETFRILHSCLLDRFPAVRSRVLRAMRKLRQERPSLRINKSFIRRQAMDEVRGYFELLTSYEVLEEPSLQPKPFVHRVLRECMDRSVENIFQCLDLLYPKADFYRGFLVVRHLKPDLRPWAVEIVDEVVKKPTSLREALLTIIDDSPLPERANKGRRLLGIDRKGIADTMADLCLYPDHWLAASALYGLFEMNLHGVYLAVRDRMDRRSKRIQDTLSFVRRKFEGGSLPNALHH